MSIYDYEGAFAGVDITSKAMRQALNDWYTLYYGSVSQGDPCQKLAYSVVSKIIRAVFGEYSVRCDTSFGKQVLDALNAVCKQAVSHALVGGSCFLKPCVEDGGFRFRVVPRSNVLIFERDALGRIRDLGCVETSIHGKYFYTLLERRSVDENGLLVLKNTLYRSLNQQSLGQQVPLSQHPLYASLPEAYVFPEPLGGVGLVELRTPILNCVDGSNEPVSVFAAAAQLIANVDINEMQLAGEFDRGQSRIVVSADMLSRDGLTDNVFVGLDDDAQNVGITVFAPHLRTEAFLARKQEYLRNIESIIGLRRGMLSDANMDDRTATEITSTAGDFNLTVIEFQTMWQEAVQESMGLCAVLGGLFGVSGAGQCAVSFDWGNGVLYDEDKTWEQYRQMVADGLLKPELALAWRFGRKADSPQALAKIRQELMPDGGETGNQP